MKKSEYKAKQNHKKIAKFLANTLGLALLTAPATMIFAGCNKSDNRGVDLYSIDVDDFNGVDLSYYDNAIEYQNQLSSTQDDSGKCLSEEKAKAYSDLMYSLGDEYAQKLLAFNKIDENGESVNSFNKSRSYLTTYIATKVLDNRADFTIFTSNSGYATTFGDFIEFYYKDRIDALLDSSDYVSEKDFINGYVSFLNGYYDNAPEYILSNYTRYEGLTDEQIDKINTLIKDNIPSTIDHFFYVFKKYFNKYKEPVSFEEAGYNHVISTCFYGNNNMFFISDVIASAIDNFYPADLMYFEQSYVNYWQECIDPLFQENFGYTWTECVNLTEDPDLHPIDWYNYENYLTLLGMTMDDVPMPTISNTATKDDATLTK